MSNFGEFAAKMASHRQCSDFCKPNPEEMTKFAFNLTITLIRSVIEFVFRNFNYLLISVILCLILYAVYKSYWSPVYYFKELTAVGFDHIPAGPDRAGHIKRVQAARKIGNRLPPPYPNGWFALVESSDLKVGGVIPVDALGLNLCVYRGEDGVARVVDAYCPHLGANLGVGGTVCGNCIECPFHQWKFGGNGSLVSVPGVDHVPKGISIKTWHSMEVDRSVWVWYDAEGRAPLWTVPEAPQMKTWGYRGRNEFLVSAHVQEIPENGADVAHLNAVHTTSVLTDAGSKYSLLSHFIGSHHWSAQWSPGSEPHTAVMTIVQKYIIMKYNIFPMKVTAHQIGPAHVRLTFDTALGPMMITQSVTPLAPLLQRVVHRVYSPAYNALLAAYTVLGEAYQFQRDVAIWNSKQYVHSPAYVKTDKSVKAFRAWFAQFYCERSTPLRDALRNNLDW